LDIDDYNEIIYLESVPYLHDCSGFRKLPRKAIDRLMNQKKIELMVIQLEGTDIFLINTGKPDIEKLKLFGSFYFYFYNPGEIELGDFADKELEAKLSEFLEKSKDKESEDYIKNLKELGFEKDIIIFKDQWD